MAEVNGIHIRDLPISAAGLPCLPSGAALPPNVLFKLHHDELLNTDAILNEHSNKIQMLSNRLDKAERMQGVSGGVSSNKSEQSNISHDDIINNTDFIAKLLDNILTNTNLSDIINQIEPLQKENESLRSLLNSQQTTLNELSGLVMKLISNGLPSYTTGSDNCEGGGGGDLEKNEYEEHGEPNEHDEIVQVDIASSVYSPYITNDENDSRNNSHNNANNSVAGNDGGNYNGMNYDMSEGDGGICSVSLDNLEEVHD
jgi:hypothetical protein